MASRNRNAGHQAEREEAKIYRDLGYSKAATSRYESRSRDDQKIDLTGTGPWNVQVKVYQNIPNYHKILNEMPQEEGQINMICHTKVEKSKKGKFMKKGKYCTIKAEDMYRIQRLLMEHCPDFQGE